MKPENLPGYSRRWTVALLPLLISLNTPTLLAAPAKQPPKAKAATSPMPQSRAVSMKAALLAALKKHPLTHIGTAQKAVGEAYRAQSKARFAGDPSYSLGYQGDDLTSGVGYREVQGSLDFPIWLAGQKQAREKLANSLISKVEAEQLQLAWQISGEVLERAWALRIAQMELEQARVRQQSAKQLQADIQRKVQAGEIARADLLLAQQSTAEANLAYQQAQAEVERARIAWQTYTGYTRIPADLLAWSRPKQVPHEQHPHMIAAKARLAAAQAQREDVRKQRRANPTLSLYAKRDRGADTDPFNNSLGVSVSVPFGTKSSSAPQMAMAHAEFVTLKAELAEQERVHELETQQARLAVQNAQRKFQLAKTRNQLAQNRWRLSRRAFELGESDLFLLIQAREQADIQARALKRSQLELNLAQARLNHILGAMPL